MKRCPKCRKSFPDEANFCPVDAGRLEVVQDEKPAAISAAVGGGALGGRFELGQRIGGQLTGEVYEATDNQGGQPCVVKLVDPKVFSTPLLLQRTERELKQLERLESAGVARVLDHGKRDGSLWVATERVAGRTLEQLVAEDGPIDSERAAKIVHSVGQALAEAAKLGVIHRDLAPKNLMVGDGDQIKIINFGVAVPTTSKVQGVAEFVAPEQVEGKPVDQRSNIYSLGALFYFMLTGEPIYSGDTESVLQAHLAGNPPAPSDKVEVSDHVNALVLKALERSSSKRFMTLRQLLGQLQGVIEGSEPGATQPLGRVGKSTVPGTGKPKGKKQADLGGTLLGMPSLPESAGAADARRDSSATIPVDSPPVHQPDPPAQPTISAPPDPAPVAAAAAPVAAAAAPAGKSKVEVDDDAATRQIPARHYEPVSAKNDTAPASSLRSESRQPRQPRPPSQSDAPVEGKAGRRAKKKKKSKGKFRETMWFKKGELDEAAAEAAATDRDGLASDKADHIPIEDRYEDDGSLSMDDQERLSLRTGSTQMMEALGDDEPRRRSEVSEEELLKEMSAGRNKLVMIIGAALLLVVVVIIIVARG